MCVVANNLFTNTTQKKTWSKFQTCLPPLSFLSYFASSWEETVWGCLFLSPPLISPNRKQFSPPTISQKSHRFSLQFHNPRKMKRDVEMDEVEAVLEKIWDLHDKLSDEIHSISRTHFVNSTKSHKNSNTQHDNIFKNNNKYQQPPQFFDHDFKDYNNNNVNGFVFFKDSDKNCAIAEARSLNSIRSALDNLEEQLEFFHTVQIQQRAERDAALARLEQSRIILSLRLAEHHGKRYKVIDEAMDFVGNVRDATCFVGSENFSNPPASAPVEQSMQKKGVNSNIFVRLVFSGLDSTKRSLQLDKLGGVLGNAALFAFSMVALLHLQQATYKDNGVLNITLKQDRMAKKLSQRDGSSSTGQLNPLDVRLARG